MAVIAVNHTLNCLVLLRNLRRIVSESKVLLRRTLSAVKNGEFERAEKLAGEIISRLDEASKVLSMLEKKVGVEK